MFYPITIESSRFILRDNHNQVKWYKLFFKETLQLQIIFRNQELTTFGTQRRAKHKNTIQQRKLKMLISDSVYHEVFKPSFLYLIGIHPFIWEQAKLDNPDPESLIPVPVVGFNALQQRMKHQEQQTKAHQQRLDVNIPYCISL